MFTDLDVYTTIIVIVVIDVLRLLTVTLILNECSLYLIISLFCSIYKVDWFIKSKMYICNLCSLRDK